MEFRNEPIYPYNLPGSILTLAMLLRLKGNDTITYNELISSLEITEESLIQMTNEIAFGCPKMLEWAVAWTELFYVHSIS
jgi:ribulose 1,5-bisphosphate carboxylase large subunit-like protein